MGERYHDRFVRAAKEQIRNPSPEVATYIGFYQDNVGDLKIGNESIGHREYQLFLKCSLAEQQQLRQIQKGL